MRMNNIESDSEKCCTQRGCSPPGSRFGTCGSTGQSDRRARIATLPDGASVPMWGYTLRRHCSWIHCYLRRTNPSGGWSPVVITVPTARTCKST